LDRTTPGFQLRWLMLPVALWLLASNLSLPDQPYTGVSLQPDGRIGTVDPGSPGHAAGLRAGDRLVSPGGAAGMEGLTAPGPLTDAAPGVPRVVLRERDGHTTSVWLVPRPLPDAERRFLAVVFAVAAAFLLLGGWVWMERRDPLTRTFYLLCLAFAVILAPPPRIPAGPVAAVAEALAVLAQLFAGPLFSHFFALFPESGRPRARAWVLAGYAAATVLLACYAGAQIASSWGASGLGALRTLLLVAPAVLFAAGLLGGLVLFALAFARTRSADARRRLRVAFLGTVCGALPFALLVGLRNVSSAPVLPGERWAVPFLLLVPLSFAWAMAVHQVFDFRVALRAFTRAASALLGAGALYVAGEWAAAAWWPVARAGATGGALAMSALLAALAGPAREWLGAAGRRLVPIADETSLADWEPEGDDEAALLLGGADAIVEALRVDGACALRLEPSSPVLARSGALLAPALSLAAAETLRHGSGPHAPFELRLAHEDRDALEQAGVHWLLPVNSRVAFAIGRRFAGPWLSRADARGLTRLARRLSVGLENLDLKREARGHGAFERELREAHAVQVRRLPRRMPVFPTLDCAASTLATEAVGGDYYDFVETGGREFTLAVGDAAGHGVPAALVLAGVQSRFRDEARRARHPGELLEAMNRDLVALEQPERFMCLLCARVEATAGIVRFANAGLTPPLLRRRDGRHEALTESGLLLGVQEGARYPLAAAELEPGDVLVVYTDGLTEAPRDGEPFGEERVWDVLDRHAHRRAADVLEELLAAVRAWGDGPLDDLTIVVLKQLARARAGAAAG